MTHRGQKLAGIDAAQLRQQQRIETDPKAINRLMLALLYLDGGSPSELEALFGYHVQTIYDWLDIFAERDLDTLGDAPHPPTASKLTPDQWAELTAVLHAPPTDAGYDAPAWRPELLQHHLHATYGVDYSLAHMYRVLNQAGLSVQRPRPRQAGARWCSVPSGRRGDPRVRPAAGWAHGRWPEAGQGR